MRRALTRLLAATALVALLLPALLGRPACHLGRRLWQGHQARRQDHGRHRQMPDALERMAAALRTGSSLAQALAAAGRTTPPPLGPELSWLADRAGRGRPLPEVLEKWTDARGDTTTRLAATALVLATRVGASPARAIDGVAATLRERASLEAERRAQATQARASAAVLSIAPLGFGALLVLTNDAVARFLFTTPLGWACLLAGLGLDAVGAAWMNRLTRADRR
jgi:tight adherence protein B